MLNINLKIQLN